ncbi:MAG TPA: tetratricopeptide repeat protein [Verrucomicrobiae bacterium]|nr:tetratricopeptide repeat protein [Verrucomicrobiae bacterium]
MTTETDVGAHKSFVRTRLPWIVAAAAAVVYLVTLNQWLAPNGEQVYARATHQQWYTDPFSPAFHLVTTPFQWLPGKWVPLAMNIFSAVCAVVVLGLLARSVALFPQDRTHKQREREQSPFGLLSVPTAWIPPVLAAVICGLQLTFWENATNSSSTIFDLLLFSYAIRCLLEYRVSDRESWLLRATVAYAAGMTDSWIMVALLPAFAITLVWMRGFAFFRLRFLVRTFLCGFAGLLLYLYPPLMRMRSDGTFWEWLRFNLEGEFQNVLTAYKYAPHPLQFLLVLTSVLPILVIGIRWKSDFGDSSQLGTALTTWIFHLTHAVLLGVCIWAAFDTGFSLRDSQAKFQFLDMSRDAVLPLYFLGALSIGYLSGYFLLIFRPVVQRNYSYRNERASLERFLNTTSVSIICAVLVLATAGLLYKNVPEIRTTNGPAWQQYAAAATENLPPKAVILSDRGDLLLLTQAWLARSGKDANFVFVETHSLKALAYHEFQKTKHPEIWPPLTQDMLKQNFRFDDSILTDLLLRLSTNAPLYYLQPSFGTYFETFYQVPHGLAYEMVQYSTNTVVSSPPMSDAVFAENEDFWKRHKSAFHELLPFMAPPGPGSEPTFRGEWMQHMHIPFATNSTAWGLGLIYSRALNTLGVMDQRLGRLDAAGAHFAEAQEFSPNNSVAEANFDFNKKLRAGERIVADSPEDFEQRFGNVNGWGQTVNFNGPFDTATGCLAQGIVFYRSRLIRQGAQQFERVLSLAPDNQLARLWLARTYVHSRTPEKALPLVEELKAHPERLEDASITPADILVVELAADYFNKKAHEIRPILEQLSSRNMLDAAVQTCITFGDFTNALIVIEKRLGSNPDDVPALMADGYVNLHMNNPVEAVVPLTHALSLQPTNSDVRLLRGAAYMGSGRLEEAKLDYQTLQKADPTKDVSVNYALGEIALRERDTNTAIRCFALSLEKMPTNSPAAKMLTDRIKSLKGGPQ